MRVSEGACAWGGGGYARVWWKLCPCMRNHVCRCACVCMRGRVHVCVRACAYVRVCEMYERVCACFCLYPRICACVEGCVCACVDLGAFLGGRGVYVIERACIGGGVCARKYMRMCVYARVYVRVCACMCACMRVCSRMIVC